LRFENTCEKKSTTSDPSDASTLLRGSKGGAG
jgi:hypothetical protein